MCNFVKLLLYCLIQRYLTSTAYCAFMPREQIEVAVKTNIEEDDADESDLLPSTLITQQDSQAITEDITDEKSVNDAIKDVAYYLRSHKFNDFDRRFHQTANDTDKDLYVAFPEPPLQTLHWEVQKYCECGFLKCLQYLHEKVLLTELLRSDDTTTLIRDQNWTFLNNLKEIDAANDQCTKFSNRDRVQAEPFRGPLERFQWRSTASYYMCWYAMQQTPQLTLFGEPCDNFANCLDPVFKASNQDPRADDRLAFQCAVYSFCPDPCCPKKHISSLQQCWNSTENPCFAEAPDNFKQCTFNSAVNRDFKSLILNRWNVSCHCSEGGFEWSSRYGICIDKDECARGLDSCDHSMEACFNLPGTYRCGCRWGYLYDHTDKLCKRNVALIIVETSGVEQLQEELKPVSIVQTIKRLSKKLRKNSTNQGIRISHNGAQGMIFYILLFSEILCFFFNMKSTA